VLDMRFEGPGGHCTKEAHPIQTPDGPVYAGGVCWIPVEPGEVVIEVMGDQGSAGFDAYSHALPKPEASVPGVGDVTLGSSCERVTGNGVAALAVPEGCGLVSVYVHAPVLVGTILISQP
jgi:hypothetical protein